MTKIAFLFPGQGAQAVGMGKDIADAFPAAADLYEQASRVLGWDVADMCFNGPREELDNAAIIQPAILTTSMAVLAAMRAAGRKEVDQCTAAAGLSLGEYSALVMADALDFTKALTLVQKRGMFMEDACKRTPGAMLSVLGLDDEIVEAICAQARETAMVVAANFNCPGQVVISGAREGLDRAAELARQRGAKRVVPLAVSGAFHSPLMNSAATRLEQELSERPFRPCRLEVIANVSAEPVKTPEDVRVSLAKQVSSPVRWSQSVRRLASEGYTRFIEVGPGKVLTGLMRRIVPDAQVENISTVSALRG